MSTSRKSCGWARLGISLLPLLGGCAFAQQDQHVSWTLSVEPNAGAPGSKALLKMAGRIDEGWHLYSASSPAAIPTKIQLAPNPAIAKYRILQPPPKRAFDANFGSDTETYEVQVAFLVELELNKNVPAGPVELALSARYQTCNPKMCVPAKWSGTATLRVDAAANAAQPVIPAGYAEPVAPASRPAGPGT